MAGLDFVGTVDGIAPRQIEFIKNVFKNLGYSEGTVKVEPVGKAGDNYSADVRRFIIEKDGKTFKMVGKIAPENEHMRNAFSLDKMFRNENSMYNVILPKYSELEKQVGIPERDRLRYAKCHGALMDEPHEIILFEDLQMEGFQMLDKFKSLPEEAIRLVLKDFATMNALSYAWKQFEPENFDDRVARLFNVWENDEKYEQMEQFMTQVENDTLDVLQDEQYKKYVRNMAGQMIEFLEELKRTEDKKYYVVQQGDSWTNNIMFRLENGKPVQSCMIDYQLSRLMSPTIDLTYLIFNCTDHRLRMKYFHEWIDYYHSQLDKYLSYHGLKAETVYPREQLDKELKKVGKLSLIISVLVSNVILREAKEAENFKKVWEAKADEMQEALEVNKIKHSTSETIEKYRIRVEEIIDSHLELELIPII